MNIEEHILWRLGEIQGQITDLSVAVGKLQVHARIAGGLAGLVVGSAAALFVSLMSCS